MVADNGGMQKGWTMTVTRTIRDLSALLFLAVVLAVPQPGVSAVEAGARVSSVPSATAQEQCGSPPEPHCGHFTTEACEGWPQDGCYLFALQGQIDQQTATAICRAHLQAAECTWAAEALPDGVCFWWCQFEMPETGGRKAEHADRAEWPDGARRAVGDCSRCSAF